MIFWAEKSALFSFLLVCYNANGTSRAPSPTKRKGWGRGVEAPPPTKTARDVILWNYHKENQTGYLIMITVKMVPIS